MTKLLRYVFPLLLVLSACTGENPRKELMQQRNHYQFKLEKTQGDLRAYVLEHKMASAALLASGTGVASLLEEKLDENARAVFVGIGLLGLAYCVSNAEECASVTAEVASYLALIDQYKHRIDAIDAELAKLDGQA